MRHATVRTYTDVDLFLADLERGQFNVKLEDFDSTSAQTAIAEGDRIGGITFANFDLRDGQDLFIDDSFQTTSGANYLGEDFAGNFNLITGGSTFDLGFAPSHAIGMSIITGEVPGASIFDGDILLGVPSAISPTPVALDVSEVQDTLGDGSLVFFLGLIDDTSRFSRAGIGYANAAIDATFFNIDDVVTTSEFQADFDKDGDVDGVDFLTWQASFRLPDGATQADGDANGDGAVDGQDFLIWQREFSREADVGVGDNGVPEPTGIGLLLIVAAAVCSLRPALIRD